MKLYIEKYDRFEGFMLADFITRIDYETFCKNVDQLIYSSDRRTMLLITNIFIKGRSIPLEGKVYNFPSKLFEFNWQKEPGFEEEEENTELVYSDIFSFRTDAGYVGEDFFGTPVFAKPFLLSNPIWNGSPCGARSLSDNIKVVVKKVGQGNWNEVYSNNRCHIIFDLGTSVYYTNIETRNVVNASNSFQDRPTLIISHWDVDHYKALFQVSNMLLKQLCCVYFPNNLISETSKRALQKLQNNCSFLVPINHSSSRKVKRKVSLDAIYSGTNFTLFCGEKSADRNKSGCLLLCGRVIRQFCLQVI